MDKAQILLKIFSPGCSNAVGQPYHGHPCLPGLGHRDADTRVAAEEAVWTDEGLDFEVIAFHLSNPVHKKFFQSFFPSRCSFDCSEVYEEALSCAKKLNNLHEICSISMTDWISNRWSLV